MQQDVARAEAWVERTRARNRAAQIRYRQRIQARPESVHHKQQFPVVSGSVDLFSHGAASASARAVPSVCALNRYKIREKKIDSADTEPPCTDIGLFSLCWLP